MRGFRFGTTAMSVIEQPPVYETQLESLELVGRGKVRDIYRVDAEHYLIVASDRLSAFDVVLPDPIPGKGRVLTQVSNFWFNLLEAIVPNHMTETDPRDVVSAAERELVEERSVVVKALKPLPLEAVVRGYLIGSGWSDYCAGGKISGLELPRGMLMADRLPQPLFTPSTKAAKGDHDENITHKDARHLVGTEHLAKIESASLAIFDAASKHAQARGLILADTKFEFGLDENGELFLIDELLTPDSSRYWPAHSHKPGSPPKSFDKQYVRDYLESLDWNKTAPGPSLPKLIIEKTAAKYNEALSRLTGPPASRQ